MKELLVNGQLVCADRVVDGWLLTEDNRIAAIGTAEEPAPLTDAVPVDMDNAYVLPGFIDVHAHGGGGHRFGGRAADNTGVRQFHAIHGTTSMLAAVGTASLRTISSDLAELGGTPEAITGCSRLLGIHLEGPYITPSRRGAHDPARIRKPDRREFHELLSVAAGRVRLVTAAPELPGFYDLLAEAAHGGCYVSAGHTDATARQFLDGFARGVRSLTHTFNAMRAITHRDPGPLAAVVDSDVFCELICDGVHVAPDMVRVLRRLAGAERIVLVTDASAWAGCADGRYTAVNRVVNVGDGAVRIAGTDTLAGSVLTMAEAARRYAMFTGAAITELAQVASANAARLLGEEDRLGALRPGHLADLVVLDQELACVGAMVDGLWLRRPDVDSRG